MSKTNICPACGGSGRALDHQAVGRALRLRRQRKGVKLRWVAERLGITSSQLSMLELGRRRWRPETIRAFKEALR